MLQKIFYLTNSYSQKLKPCKRTTQFSTGLHCQALNQRRTQLVRGCLVSFVLQHVAINIEGQLKICIAKLVCICIVSGPDNAALWRTVCFCLFAGFDCLAVEVRNFYGLASSKTYPLVTSYKRFD
jgi:hypothetical protein